MYSLIGHTVWLQKYNKNAIWVALVAHLVKCAPLVRNAEYLLQQPVVTALTLCFPCLSWAAQNKGKTCYTNMYMYMNHVSEHTHTWAWETRGVNVLFLSLTFTFCIRLYCSYYSQFHAINKTKTFWSQCKFIYLNIFSILLYLIFHL